MLTRLSVMSDNLNSIVHEINENPEMNKCEFKSMAVSNFSKGIKQFDMIMKDLLGVEIFNLVIDSCKGYNRWEDNLMIYTRTMVDNVCDTDIYDNNLERGAALLSIYQAVTDTIIVVVEKTFNSFNGDLDKLIQKKRAGLI